MNAITRKSEPPAQPGPAIEPTDITALPAANAPRVRKPVSFERFFGLLSTIGLGFLVPVIRLCRGENPAAQVRELWQSVGVPMLAIAVFLLGWSQASRSIETSLGNIPGPTAVLQQTGALWADHKAERAKA